MIHMFLDMLMKEYVLLYYVYLLQGFGFSFSIFFNVGYQEGKKVLVDGN